MSASQGQQTSKIVPFDSDEAAQRKSVEGWVSRDGYYYAEDERTARYAGCTHVKCADCSALIPKTNAVCDPCATIRLSVEFATLPKELWDTQTPLVLFETDTYFFDVHSVTHYCRQHSTSPEQLQLVICEPVYGSELDAADFLSGELPEDGEIPEGILEAAIKFNEAIKAAGPLCWVQGTSAATIDPASLSTHSDLENTE
jgi:hypothetical protein